MDSQLNQSGITEEQIRLAYRYFLGREPESERVVQEKVVALRTMEQLRGSFLHSAEFLETNGFAQVDGSIRPVIKELEGFRIFVDLSDRDIGLNIVNECYENAEQRFVRETVKTGQVALDIGANVGLFSLLLASLVGPEGHVHSFEPFPRVAAQLERSREENSFESYLTINRVAVGSEAATIDLISPRVSTNWGGSYLRSPGNGVPNNHTTISVSVIRLDDYSIDRKVDFIKMDVEGAELHTIRGAHDLLQRDRPVILAELNPRQLELVSGCGPTDVIQHMAGLGFQCQALTGGGMSDEPLDRYDGPGIQSVVFRFAASS